MSTMTESSRIVSEKRRYVLGPRVPRGLAAVVEGLAREVLRQRPDDIYVFAAHHFEHMIKLREQRREWKGDDCEAARLPEGKGKRFAASIESRAKLESRRRTSGWSVDGTVKILKRTVREAERTVVTSADPRKGKASRKNISKGGPEAVACANSEGCVGMPSRSSLELEFHVGEPPAERTRDNGERGETKRSGSAGRACTKDRAEVPSTRCVLQRDLESPKTIEVDAGWIEQSFEDRGSSLTSEYHRECRDLRRSNTWDDTLNTRARRQRDRSVDAVFLPAVRSAPPRRPRSGSANETGSDSRVGFRNASRNGSRNGSGSTELTLPPISRDARRSGRKRDGLTLPALPASAATRGISQPIEKTRDTDPTSEEIPRPRTTEPAQASEEPAATSERLDLRDRVVESSPLLGDEEAFEDSLNVTPTASSSGLTPRTDSLEATKDDGDSVGAPCAMNELRKKLIEIETVERSIERTLVDSGTGAALDSQPSTPTSAPISALAREATKVLPPPGSTISLPGDKAPHFIAEPQSIEGKNTEINGKTIAEEGTDETRRSGSDVDDLDDDEVERPTGSCSRNSPLSYVLTEGSPCEIPESAVTVIIPERPLREKTEEECRELDASVVDELCEKRRLYASAIDVFGEYVSSEESAIEFGSLTDGKSALEPMVVLQNLFEIKEEEEEEEETEKDRLACAAEEGEVDNAEVDEDRLRVGEHDRKVEEVEEVRETKDEVISEVSPKIQTDEPSGHEVDERNTTEERAIEERASDGESTAPPSVQKGESVGGSVSVDVARPTVPELNLDSILRDVTVSSCQGSELEGSKNGSNAILCTPRETDGTLSLQESLPSEREAPIEQLRELVPSSRDSSLKSSPKSSPKSHPGEPGNADKTTDSSLEEEIARELIENDRSERSNGTSDSTRPASGKEDPADSDLPPIGHRDASLEEREVTPKGETREETEKQIETQLLSESAERRNDGRRDSLRERRRTASGGSNVAGTMDPENRRSDSPSGARMDDTASKEGSDVRQVARETTEKDDNGRLWHTGEYHDSLPLLFSPVSTNEVRLRCARLGGETRWPDDSSAPPCQPTKFPAEHSVAVSSGRSLERGTFDGTIDRHRFTRQIILPLCVGSSETTADRLLVTDDDFSSLLLRTPESPRLPIDLPNFTVERLTYLLRGRNVSPPRSPALSSESVVIREITDADECGDAAGLGLLGSAESGDLDEEENVEEGGTKEPDIEGGGDDIAARIDQEGQEGAPERSDSEV